MGTVRHQEMHHRHSLQEICTLGREMLTWSSLHSRLKDTARPSATRAGRFSVAKVVKKATIDEKSGALALALNSGACQTMRS